MAANGDIIRIPNGMVVQLTTGSIVLNKVITIEGGAGSRITRAANAPSFRLLRIDNFTRLAGYIFLKNLIFSNSGAMASAAVSNGYPNLNVNNCTFEDNPNRGLESDIESDFIEIENCLFRNNGSSGFLLFLGKATLLNSDFYGNFPAVNASTGSRLVLQRCTIRGNKEVGLALSNATTTIVNSTITGNRASSSGGLFVDGGSVNLHSSTISGNIGQTGRAVRLLGNATLSATNTIFWGNGTELEVEAGSTAMVSHSIVQGGFSGSANIDANPLFVTPNANNGSTPDISGNFRLTSCSPAINAGIATNAPNIDLFGTARPQLGTYDIGAHESTNAASTGTIYVLPAAMGNNSGSSWANAYTSLQAALTFALQCPLVKQIWVANGAYKPTTDLNRETSFNLGNNLAIYGGFAGTETQLSQRNWQLNQTILSGDIGSQGSTQDNTYNIVAGFNVNSTAILDGFTISNANAFVSSGYNSTSRNANGGGLYIQNSSPTISNCTFKDNNVRENGGGIFNYSGAPTITNCIFSGNRAQWGGGLMNYLNAAPSIKNCLFYSNRSFSSGGAIFNNSTSNPTIIHTTFSNNIGVLGLAMANYNSSVPVISNSIIWESENGIQQLNRAC